MAVFRPDSGQGNCRRTATCLPILGGGGRRVETQSPKAVALTLLGRVSRCIREIDCTARGQVARMPEVSIFATVTGRAGRLLRSGEAQGARSALATKRRSAACYESSRVTLATGSPASTVLRAEKRRVFSVASAGQACLIAGSPLRVGRAIGLRP